MGHINQLEAQNLLGIAHEYPYFQTWSESLEFEEFGVLVKAVAIHSWREERIEITHPFAVSGHQHNVGFSPPLFAIGASFSARKAVLEINGLTVRDDCLRLARLLYRKHLVHLQSKR